MGPSWCVEIIIQLLDTLKPAGLRRYEPTAWKPAGRQRYEPVGVVDGALLALGLVLSPSPVAR